MNFMSCSITDRLSIDLSMYRFWVYHKIFKTYPSCLEFRNSLLFIFIAYPRFTTCINTCVEIPTKFYKNQYHNKIALFNMQLYYFTLSY